MSEYKQLFDMLHYYLETLDKRCIKALKEGYSEYRKTYDDLDAISVLPWFTDLLNDHLTEPITIEQAKTIRQFINLQSTVEYDLKVMFYVCGMKDASVLDNIFEQLND